MIILVIINLTILRTLKQRIRHPGLLWMKMIFLDEITACVVLCCESIFIVKVKCGLTIGRFFNAHAIGVVGIIPYGAVIDLDRDQPFFMVVHIFSDFAIFSFSLRVAISVVGI